MTTLSVPRRPFRLTPPPAWLCILALATLPGAGTASMTLYRLNDLAARLTAEPLPLRTDLARITLEELAAAYSEEALRARRDARGHADASGLWRWAAAVEKLAADYRRLAADVLPDTPVEVSAGPEGNLYLIVAGKPVIASSPRVHEQAAFEQQILARFCELNRCADLLDATSTDAIPVSGPEADRAAVQWSFSQHAGPVCASGDGLEFQFLNMDNLGPKRDACARAVAELNLLADSLAREVAGGIRIDWDLFVIQHLPDGEEQVLLNGSGDYLRLRLPLLVARQELVGLVRPWLAAQVNGRHYALVVLNAGRVLAPAGRPLD
ncbi:MAG: hypothetical protein R3F42_06880 [Pseudomonadota bacterium]